MPSIFEKTVIGLFALIALTGTASANDNTLAKGHSPVGLICAVGRMGGSLEEVGFDMKNITDSLHSVWEGCRQETIKDFSCYPYTINEANNSRTIYMPGSQPSNALYEPWVADCTGRVGRFPAWKGVKEDGAETERMAVFYFNNPPGELQKPRSR
jgi:hypothetical protein